MAATIELKYFNTFWLKKIKTIADVTPGYSSDYVSHSGFTFEIAVDPSTGLGASVTQMNVGQEVTMTYTDLLGVAGKILNAHIVERISDTEFLLDNTVVNGVDMSADHLMVFGKITDFNNIPQAYGTTSDSDWLIEEARISGGYNNTSVDFGAKAYLVEEETSQSHRASTLIHSGIFNSRTGINQTNQFSVAEDITRTVDPSNGSIQRLYAEDTNLIIFQENKVSRSLIDKDAIYSAEGDASVTSRNLVIGQNVAYAGEYGISKDPESFAVNGYRKYFTDRDQNVVCRLSMDGITLISDYGMTDYFRDKLSTNLNNGFIIGGWDAHNKQYVLSIQEGTNASKTPTPGLPYVTLAFDESVLGWVSLFDYQPNQIISLNNDYFTAKGGKLYKHYTLAPSTQSRGIFYGTQFNSQVTFIFNAEQSTVKNFQTINYEGDTGWVMDSFITNTDYSFPITQATFATSLTQMQNALLMNTFKQKEDKYFANLVNATPSHSGEIIWGASSSGVKGFYAKVTMRMQNAKNAKKELFAVSTGFVTSSY
jgi:hypothetical protein